MFFCYCNFVSSFTPPSFLCTPIFSFSFLLGCCVILTSEVPSALTGEAAGELGCSECQAASMFKAEGGRREDRKKKTSIPLEDFWQFFWFPPGKLAAKGEFPPGSEGFAFRKLPLSLLMAPLYLLFFRKHCPIALCSQGNSNESSRFVSPTN